MSSTQEAGDIFGPTSGPANPMLRSPTVLIISIGLWGMNVFFFRLFGIDYIYVLNYDLMKEQQQLQQQQQQQDDDDNNNINIINNNNNNSSTSEFAVVATNNTSNRSITKVFPARSHGLIDRDDNINSTNHSSVKSITDDGSLDEDSTSFDVPPHHIPPGAAITWNKLVFFSLSLLLLLHVSSHYWMEHLGRGTIGAVFIFYGLVFIYILIPLPSTRWLRRAAIITLQRCCELLNPRCSWIFQPPESGPRPIPFVDVFVADAMCSLSKVFFDWGMLIHIATHFPDPVPPALHNIVFPSFCAAVPYIIRARQCLIMHTVGFIKNDPKRTQHLANALKYSTSIFPLVFSAYLKTIEEELSQNTAKAERMEFVLTVLLTTNALYALYWDIVMDWGMMQNPTAVVQTAVQTACIGLPEVQHPPPPACHHALLRPRLRFGLLPSVIIVLADSLLRFSWTLKYTNLFPKHDNFVLATQFLEVFRRAIWNLLRVEWENIKQKRAKATEKADDSFTAGENDSERAGFLQMTPVGLTSGKTSTKVALA